MLRREFVKLIGGAVAWPLAARAQQATRLPLVAILRSEGAGHSEGLRNTAALVHGLRALGWTEGHNVRIEERWAGGSVDAMKALARELVALEPKVIVVVSTPVTASVMQETHTIPIIFLQNFDPVGSRFVKSLAAPGGNITGFTSYEPAIASKWLELLKEVAPQAARVTIIYNPQTAPFAGALLRSIETAGPVFAIQPIAMPNSRRRNNRRCDGRSFCTRDQPRSSGVARRHDTVHEKLIVKLAVPTSVASRLPRGVILLPPVV